MDAAGQDPQSATSMQVGTCWVWSGPRSGGAFTVLSLNFDTLGTGTCAGTEVNTVRAPATYTNASGSQLIYSTTDGLGPSNLTVTRPGGYVLNSTGGITVLQVVAAAWGSTHLVPDEKTRLLRSTENGFQEQQIDLKKLLRGKSNDVSVRNEDILFIPSGAAKTALNAGAIASFGYMVVIPTLCTLPTPPSN